MTKLLVSTTALLASLSVTQAATVLFEFNNNGDLDGNQPAGTTTTQTENGETVTLTTVELMAPDFNDPMPFDNLITLGVDTGINSGDGLGINNPSISNAAFNTATGAGSSENTNFNFMESLTFELDQDVTIESIDFASLGGSVEFLRINVDGVATDFDFFNGNPGDIFTDPLAGLIISAGTDITFTALGSSTETNLRVDSFTVDVIPEPSTVFLSLLGGAFVLRRRR